MMGSKQVGLLLTVVMLVLAFDCGNCNTQEIGKVVSIRSNAVTRVESYESVLRRDSRSVHRSRRTILNSIEIQEAIENHNRVRRLVGASDMEKMTWSNDLAIMAENWAKNCLWEHEPGLGKKNMGQNIYASSASSVNVPDAIQQWYNEKADYNYDTLGCKAADQQRGCGHYTQVVWATSREVGCGYWSCSQLAKWKDENAVILVCNYRPTGNVETLKPFQKGSGCSRCANGSWWCNEGLCDGSCTATTATCGCAPVCLNFASINMATCSCSCTPGWHGSDCSVECKNYDSQCDPQPGQWGWPPSLCTDSKYGPQVREKCPKMCNQCNAVGGNNSTSMRPSLLNLLSVWLSWLLLYIFWSS